ncbi:MAG: acyl-CoA dehydrogenase family protein [Pseudomonadota bacterium]
MLNQQQSQLEDRLKDFMQDFVYPAEAGIREGIASSIDRWAIPAALERLKEQARDQGLWNLWCGDQRFGPGLNNSEYAPLAEIMGRSMIAPEVFNCNAPDTGNMETLIEYGTKAQQEQWLIPLLDGTIRSAFCMTEPEVASSDATNICTTIRRDRDSYVIDGHKWWSTGAMDPRCQLLIVMGKTSPQAHRHKQQSMVLVPIDTPGVEIVRPMMVFGSDDAPHGHAEIVFNQVRVPVDNLLLGEGRGFEIAQGRLGPGRIHHCMRLIGCAERALEESCLRANQRIAFAKKLSEQGSLREDLANMACEIHQARLLTMDAAKTMDAEGKKKARHLIAMAKIVVPRMAQSVLDRAIQIHGAKGVSQDTFLAEAFAYARTIRIADGPDQVHQHALARHLLEL